MNRGELEVAIIGAGTAGLTARRAVAAKTDNYRVFDPGPLGTTCARVGCMPSKALIQVANDFHRRHHFTELGIIGTEHLRINQPHALKRVRKLRDRFVSGVMKGMDSWEEESLIKEKVKITGPGQLETERGQKFTAKKIILACGSTPFIPEIWRPHKDFILTSDEIFEQDFLPKKMAIVGTGIIGLELGQALSRLGVEVIMLGRGPRFGGMTHPELNKLIYEDLSKELTFDFSEVLEIIQEKGKLSIKTSDKDYVVDKALLATGRVHRLDECGLSSLGLNLSAHGIPQYNPDTMQIENLPLFIAGDTNGFRPLLHEAADEGFIAGTNAVSEEIMAFKRRVPLSICFSSPEICSVGESFKDLTEKNKHFEFGEVSFTGQGRSLVMDEAKGKLIVYADLESEKLLGADFYGPRAEHLAHLLSWVIQQELTLTEILRLPFYHPVVEEGLRTALQDVSKKILHKKNQSPPQPLAKKST